MYTPSIPGLSIPGTGYLPSIGYPPLWPLLQALVYDLYSAIGIDNRFLYYFLIKQEMIVPDIVAAYLIFTLLRKHGLPEGAKKALTFWILCPFVIVVSAVWGMFDQLVLALLLGALLLSQGTIRSSLLEGVGILLKGVPVIYLPILSLSQGTTWKKLLYLLAAVILTLVLTLFPYALGKWKIAALTGTGIDIIHKVGNSVNYWVVPYALSNLGIYDASGPVLSLLGYVWIPALVFSYVVCYRFLKKGGISSQGVVLCMLFSTLVLFLTRTQINEQYVIYFLGLGLIDICSGGRERAWAFHGVWISAGIFLVANNDYMLRFLSPISIYYSELGSSLTSGLLGDLRFYIMVAAGLSFTFFCLAYLRSIYRQFGRPRESAQGEAQEV